MATSTPQLGFSATRQRVMEIVRALLEELGSVGAVPLLAPNAHLDRELGLGSLERVELLARLEAEFAVRLQDKIASEANTPEELTRALLESSGHGGSGHPGENNRGFVTEENGSASRASIAVEKEARAASESGVLSAETLV